MQCYNGFDGKTYDFPLYSPTNESLRQPGKYWIVSDAQLKRDLKPRTLRDIYRENRAGRDPLAKERRDFNVDLAAYQAWCDARGHVPHPASIDPDHPINRYRLKMPRMERVKDDPEYRMAA